MCGIFLTHPQSGHHFILLEEASLVSNALYMFRQQMMCALSLAASPSSADAVVRSHVLYVLSCSMQGLVPPERFITHGAAGGYMMFPMLLDDLDLLARQAVSLRVGWLSLEL